MARILVVTAVAAEREAVLSGRANAAGTVEGLPTLRSQTGAGLVDVVVSGVGPVAAAVATTSALRKNYDVVISAGVGGGFAPVAPGDVVVADAVAHADLGAQRADGQFMSMSELGWGQVRHHVDGTLAAELSERCRAQTGMILTVSTTTGTQERADQLIAAYPDAVAEAMEGVGVLLAARHAGVAFAEVRAVSNLVGPRDRESWRLADALGALSKAFEQLLATELPTTGSP